MQITRKHWRLLGALSLVLLLGLMVTIGRGENKAEALVVLIRQAGWLPFFAAMTLLPLVAFPVSPFYLLGGAVFGEWWCLLGTAVSLLINLLLSYALSAYWMRGLFENLLAKNGHRQLPRFDKRNAWLYVLATRVTPGPPLSVKNYLAGLGGVPFKPYLLLSWPIAMGYASGLIVLGDSITTEHRTGMLVGILLLAVFMSLMYAARRRLTKGLRNARRRVRSPNNR